MDALRHYDWNDVGRPLCGVEVEGALLVDWIADSTCIDCHRAFDAHVLPPIDKLRGTYHVR